VASEKNITVDSSSSPGEGIFRYRDAERNRVVRLQGLDCCTLVRPGRHEVGQKNHLFDEEMYRFSLFGETTIGTFLSTRCERKAKNYLGPEG
jgi:hypothetical protein